MSSANTYRDTTSADYLNEMRKELAQKRAEDTKASTPTASYIIPSYGDIIDLSDNATGGPASNTSTASDTIDISDAVTNNQYTTMNFTDSTGATGNMRWNLASFTNSTGAIS